MDKNAQLLAALRQLEPELPGLFGPDWPQVADRLRQLRDELTHVAPARASIIRVTILNIFGNYPAAHTRLVATLDVMQAGAVPKGGLERHYQPPAATTRPAATTVIRYTDIACPSQVWVQTPRIAVVVRLTVQPPVYSAAIASMALDTHLPVRLRLAAPGFDLLNAAEQETPVLPGADSPPVVFDLRPHTVGPTRVTVDFFQAGNLAGTVSVAVEITAAPSSAVEIPRHALALRIAPSAEPPAYQLHIAYERFQQRPALVFTLFRGNKPGQTFHPVPLMTDPQTEANRLLAQLTDLTDHLDPTAKLAHQARRTLPAADAERRLRSLGQNLWKSLIPADLKAVYEHERGAWRDASMLLVSDEPYFPWELLWPYGEGWQDPDEGPWCLTLRLTRWLRRDEQGNGHDGPPTTLSLRRLACLAPTDSGLNYAQDECDHLRSQIAGRGLRDASPTAATWSDTLDLLEGGDFDWLHVAAHGSFYSDTPDLDAALWLQDGRSLTPDSIVGPAIEAHLKRQRPGFVFNACHGSRQGWALTGLGGWANRLISSGAGLFLAPLWTVTDRQAAHFAVTFYERLFAGDAVADAVRQARLAARQVGDPTWLAYSVYAHPNARLVAGA
ncbi:CHAT domain-containing protein [Candidatus Amarolinea dominans]|uniref:CHAT domain-containing protein n=1 Tax=Candidatus Amarolinea dominans TaxID=3140696 RepID=UPI001DF14602|nr:CHAT domain-containing protein [Anaerolineae bacterium]